MSDIKPAEPSGGGTERRSFLVRFWAVVCGGIIAIFPFAAGFGVAIDPMRSRKAKGASTDSGGHDPIEPSFVRICSIEEIPTTGIPIPFPVTASVVDAWTHSKNQRIGLVFLSRTNNKDVVAFNAACPHLGCFVDFNVSTNDFECPCHKSAFAKDGKYIYGPSRRGLDPLEVKLEPEGDQTGVLVAFQNFESGIAERKPVE